jgi:hypothetical protein
MGVGLTSLGHPWTGRRRSHNHYVIGDPADTTPTAHSVGTAGRRSPSTGDCGPPGGATEELLSTTLLGSLARGHKADYSGAARVQRFPAPPAADPTGNAGHRAEPRRSCSATTPSRRVGRRPRWGNCGPQYVLRRSCLVLRDSATPTADLSRDACSGGAAGATCRSKHLKALWTTDSDGAAGRTGRRSSMTSEADHVGDTVTSDY